MSKFLHHYDNNNNAMVIAILGFSPKTAELKINIPSYSILLLAYLSFSYLEQKNAFENVKKRQKCWLPKFSPF